MILPLSSDIHLLNSISEEKIKASPKLVRYCGSIRGMGHFASFTRTLAAIHLPELQPRQFFSGHKTLLILYNSYFKD